MKTYRNIYFIGIGGIGMSALARYFKANGCEVCGYDRTETELTKKLCSEGIPVHYADDADAIPETFKTEKSRVMVVYTPAVPAFHSEWCWFAAQGYTMMKRAEVLGAISRSKKTIAVAGTHGKTSISTMTAHLLTSAGVGCDAFLGGISKNYGTNLLLSPAGEYVVAEADEYDRSFLHLYPAIAVVTATDADHLDVYGTHAELKHAFNRFVSQIRPNGFLIARHDLQLAIPRNIGYQTYSLSDDKADFFAESIRLEGDRYVVTLDTPFGTLPDICIGVPGLVNVENAIAAIAAAMTAGVPADRIHAGMMSFEGVQRRFDYRVRTNDVIYIDDYAHHPEELRFTIESVRAMYPGRHITGVFQPHLYTRTRDFAAEFAQSLSLLDELILLDIYPAREEPIEGVTSKIIFDRVCCPEKCLCAKNEALDILKNKNTDVLLTMGAGDIDTLAKPIAKMLNSITGCC